MKSILIFFLALTTAVNVLTAQTTFSVTTLEKLCGYSYADFDSYMLKRGYSLSHDYSNDTSQMYLSDLPRKNGLKDQCVIGGTSLNKTVTFTTTDKAYYINAIESLASRGYKLTSKKYDKAMKTYSYEYSNGVLTAWFKTFTFSIAPDNGYSVTIFKN